MNEDAPQIPGSELDRLERLFPPISAVAFAAARERVLASGQSVLQVEAGAIYEVFPDGRRFVKAVEPAIPVVAGSKIILK